MIIKRICIFFAAILALTACKRDQNHVSPALISILETQRPNPYETHAGSIPDDHCVPMPHRLRTPLGKLFADLNPTHLSEARSGGIRPITDSNQAWEQAAGLVKIVSTKYYFVDELNYSYPYLKPHAANLLAEIGRRFHDSLQARGGGCYRPKVTSVLRTPLSVKRLRRVNKNATAESAHQYATTFDISYSKFICDNIHSTHRTFEDLKLLLAEIINDLREENMCVVKHERHQSCFHITAVSPEDGSFYFHTEENTSL